jgi:hypothetical protein
MLSFPDCLLFWMLWFGFPSKPRFQSWPQP